jgi:putative membrane protein
MTPMSEEDAERVEAAFDAANLRTRGPLVGVLASASSDYAFMPLLWSGLLTLATPWPLLVFTQLSAERIFLIQLIVCLVSLAALSFAPLRVLLTPSRVRRANAHRAALVQYAVRGIDRAYDRNGVLIYLSLAEHYARIVADDGACQIVSKAQWQAVVDAMVADVKSLGPVDALSNAAARCADLLEAAFPADLSSPPLQVHRFHIV